MEQAVPILFYCLAVLAVAGGIGVLVFKSPIRAARSLLVTFAVVALLFLLRNAVLLALIHGLVFCGGTILLLRFLATRPDDLGSSSRPAFVSELVPLVIVAGVLFGVVASLALIFGVPAPGQGDGTALRSVDGEEVGNVVALVAGLFTTYFVPLVVVLLTCVAAACGARRLVGDTAVVENGEGKAG